MKVNGVIVKKILNLKNILMVLMLSIVPTVGSMSNEDECPDCGCPVDEHKGDFCMNCGEECETNE